MESWNDLPTGEMELTVESEAYLELAKYDLAKCEFEDARKELEIAVRSANPQAEYLLGYLYDHALGVDRDVEKVLFRATTKWACSLRAGCYMMALARRKTGRMEGDGSEKPPMPACRTQ